MAPVPVTFAGPYDADNTRLNEADWERFITLLRGDGRVAPGLAVSAGSQYEILVSAGEALVRGHYVRQDTTATLTLDAPPVSGTRYDAVVVRSLPALDKAELDIKLGDTTSGPAMQQDATMWETRIAYIATPSTATSAADATITMDAAPPTVDRLGARYGLTVGEFGATGAVTHRSDGTFSVNGNTGSFDALAGVGDTTTVVPGLFMGTDDQSASVATTSRWKYSTMPGGRVMASLFLELSNTLSGGNGSLTIPLPFTHSGPAWWPVDAWFVDVSGSPDNHHPLVARVATDEVTFLNRTEIEVSSAQSGWSKDYNTEVETGDPGEDIFGYSAGPQNAQSGDRLFIPTFIVDGFI